jgi:putative Holliday junction resolvase
VHFFWFLVSGFVILVFTILVSPMRSLAIDLGTRRVGLAMSDEGGRFATPVDVLQVAGTEAAIDPIVKIIADEAVERVVVGLPLNMDDSIGPAARAAVQWGTMLADRAKVPVIYVDERLSSFAAEQTLNDRKRGGEKITRGKKKQQLDALAAADFLQAFLDGRLKAVEIEAL